MAIQLYKKGDAHEVRGVKCEVKNFAAEDLDLMLADGWYKDPTDIDKTEETINPVRSQAKEAGIEGWDIKRIKTLEGLLDGTEN